MTKSAQGAINHVDEVRVSEGTRKMARPAGGEVLTFLQEYNALNVEKKELEARLSSGYSKTAFMKEQMKIRRESGDSFQKWMSRKIELENEKQRIVARKLEVEKRMAFIKDRAMEQKTEEHDDKTGRQSVFFAMLDELKAIRKLLENLPGLTKDV